MTKMITKVLFGFCLFSFALLASTVSAITNTLPQLQALYGGQISGLNIIQPAGTTNQVRIFLKTDFSANSIFYADLNYSLVNPFSTNHYSWHVVPDFDAEAEFGTVSEIAAHQESGRLFVADDFGVFSCTTTAGSLVTNIPATGGSMFITVCIQDAVLLAIASRQGSDVLYFGALDSSGTFAQGTGSPINVGLHAFSSTAIQLAVHPTNHCVYIIDSYGTNGILKSSAAYDALSAATTFSSIDISSVITNWALGRQIGFGPDGRMFIGSKVTSSSFNTIAYSDNDGTSWTVVDTGVIGKGCNFDTTGSAAQYNVVIGRAVSTNKGAAGSWFALGANDPPGLVRANDSSSKFDPINSQFIYFASDQGVGCTTNGGSNLREIDFGLEAVCIQSVDMNDAKTLGWTASPSGLRRGVGSAGVVQWESTGMFPMDDSAPYYSVAMDKTDSSGNTVYAGNGYIYKTTDGGTNWTKVYQPASSSGAFISSIAAEGDDVFAGIYVWSGLYNGGLVRSGNSGSTWHDVSLEGTNGINVNKVLFTEESGTPTVYVAAEFNTNSSLGGHIYRITQSDTSHMLLSSDNVSIRDLVKDSSGGIYASGWDQNYQSLVFYKPSDSSEWTQLTTNGLPDISFYSTGRGPVITVGHDSSSNDMPVVGAGVSLYYLSSGASAWITSADLHYPNGTKLNVLYWDDLLVGTTIGLYGQSLSISSGVTPVTGDIDGDRLADLISVTNTNWYVWFSTAQYLVRGGPYVFNIAGTPVTGDIDGDRLADIISVSGTSWYVWFSTAQYLVRGGPYVFNISGTPVTGDIDGDGLADIISVTGTSWYVWFSTAQYLVRGGPYTFDVSGTPVTGDIDGDGLADIISVTGTSWYVWFSTAQYLVRGGPYDLGISGTPATGDIDGDGLADLIEVVGSNWYVWFSTAQYLLRGGPYTLSLP